MRASTLIVAGIALGLIAPGAVAPASAQVFVSRYTSTAPKACTKIDESKGEGDWVVWSCPGVADSIVLVLEDDLRTTVSIAPDAEAAKQQPASSQSFGPFNIVNDTLEWRSPDGGAPFATIQRWFLSDNAALDKDGRPTSVGMLVVTRLAPACHVAYVDARANPDHNALARQAAEEHARTFNCSDKPMVIGNRGRAIELSGR
jgi:hypothetical protein